MHELLKGIIFIEVNLDDILVLRISQNEYQPRECSSLHTELGRTVTSEEIRINSVKMDEMIKYG